MQTFLAVVDLLKGVAWPIALFGIAVLFQRDVRGLFPRLRKAGPSGVEFDPVATQQRATSSAAQSGELRDLPGLPRTKAIEAMERRFHSELAHIAENERSEPSWICNSCGTGAVGGSLRDIVYGGTIFGQPVEASAGHGICRDGFRFRCQRSLCRAALARQFPQLEEYGFGGWIGFLLEPRARCTRRFSDFSLTEVGRDFLRFLAASEVVGDARPL